MYIDNYTNFLYKSFIFESSKNDPIPELNKLEKTAIFVFGIPGAGKTTFIENRIKPFISNYKIFNPDDLNKLIKSFSKKELKYSNAYNIDDKELKKQLSKTYKTLQNYNIKLDIDEETFIHGKNNKFVENTTNLTIKYMLNYLKTGNNLIYDTTGNDLLKISTYISLAREYNYNVILIRLKTDLSTAIERNLSRDRSVSIPYQLDSYLKSIKIDKEFLKLKPDSFYVVVNLNNKYKYFKYDENGNLLKRKTDKYIPIKKQ